MATENQEVVKQQTSEDTTQNQAESTEVNVESVEAKIAELQEQLTKQQEIVEKARKGEKYQKNLRDTEVKKVQALYEAEKARAEGLETKIRNTAIDGTLRQALSESGARAVDTALKLIDRNAIKFGSDGAVDAESVKAVVAALKGSDSILFEEVTKPNVPVAANKPAAPPIARAIEGDAKSGFETEIKACKTQAQIQAVLKKYGKA